MIQSLQVSKWLKNTRYASLKTRKLDRGIIHVASTAAASSVARAPSTRRLTSQKGAGGNTKPGQNPKKPAQDRMD
ncbi:hypothetical protein RIF29_10395 [Crotalaria pallida]|uniref:Uncharacterized protein n=1 Tax=Crotalaria pallida TaxID=3830 RepID=A0AAN9FV74_CROPI